MDCTEIKVEMAEELEPLVITEDGDEAQGVCEKEAASGLAVETQSRSDESTPKKEEEHTEEDKNGDDIAANMCLEEQSLEKQPSNAEDEVVLVVKEDKEKENKPEEDDNREEQNRAEGESEGQKHNKKREEGEEVTQDEPQVDAQKKDSSEQQSEGLENKAADLRKAHRLTPDFPESLYELLCTLQEGRRLNDQRCSFSLESGVRRRRCHSEPNTSRPANRVVFSSMTSLQKEEFFDLVATAQARRLDDQRAKLGSSEPSKSKGRSFRGSIRHLSLIRRPAPASTPPPPAPAPKEDLYDMILTTQAQGRLEDQRSRAPGPMDDDDFFSLLLRVQGGRMDEQRTELPCMLQT